MDVCLFFLHLVTDFAQLACRAFPSVFFIQEKCRVFGERGAVFPNDACQILICCDTSLFPCGNLGICFPCPGIHCPAIKPQAAAFAQLFPDIFFYCGNSLFPHAVKLDRAICKLFLCLYEISPVRPQPCFLLRNDGRTS